MVASINVIEAVTKRVVPYGFVAMRARGHVVVVQIVTIPVGSASRPVANVAIPFGAGIDRDDGGACNNQSLQHHFSLVAKGPCSRPVDAAQEYSR